MQGWKNQTHDGWSKAMLLKYHVNTEIWSSQIIRHSWVWFKWFGHCSQELSRQFEWYFLSSNTYCTPFVLFNFMFLGNEMKWLWRQRCTYLQFEVRHDRLDPAAVYSTAYLSPIRLNFHDPSSCWIWLVFTIPSCVCFRLKLFLPFVFFCTCESIAKNKYIYLYIDLV